MFQSVPTSVPFLSVLALLGGCVDADAPLDSSDSGLYPSVPEPGMPDADVVELADPCEGLGTPTLHADSPTRLVVGCGNGRGLWHSTTGGAEFLRAHPSEDLYVFDLKRARDGALLVCGHDYDADGVLLYAGEPGGDWTPLLRYGNHQDNSAAAYLSNCGAVAEATPGALVVASLTAGDITRSEDGGVTWSKEERYWEDDNLEPDGYGFHYLFELVTAGDHLYGAGGQVTEAPAFFAPSTHRSADWWNLNHVVVDPSVEGEVWALATTDGGVTWLAGGRDQTASSRASGFLYRSTDGGETWAALPLPAGTDIVRDVAFDEHGRFGVAVGHRYPVTEGGFALVTSDGGASWSPLELDTPLLESAAVAGGTFWLAGDAYLARGAF